MPMSCSRHASTVSSSTPALSACMPHWAQWRAAANGSPNLGWCRRRVNTSTSVGRAGIGGRSSRAADRAVTAPISLMLST